MYKVGIIGCGKIAQVHHIPEYLANPEMRVVGYSDLNTRRAQGPSVAHEGGACTPYQRMLDDPAVDAVSVCTVNTTHAEIATVALRAGKYVLCEKPMAFALEECGAMVVTARETSRPLMISHSQGLIRARMLVKWLMGEGMIERLLTFHTAFDHGGPEIWSIDAGRIT